MKMFSDEPDYMAWFLNVMDTKLGKWWKVIYSPIVRTSQLEEDWKQKNSLNWLDSLLKIHHEKDTGVLEHLLRYQSDFLKTPERCHLLEDSKWVHLLKKCNFSLHRTLMMLVPYQQEILQRIVDSKGTVQAKAVLHSIYYHGWKHDYIRLIEELPLNEGQSPLLEEISTRSNLWFGHDFAFKHLCKYGIHETTIRPALPLTMETEDANHLSTHRFTLCYDSGLIDIIHLFLYLFYIPDWPKQKSGCAT